MQAARSNQLNQSNRSKGYSIERAYIELWRQDKIDQNRYAQFFCAASTGAQTPEEIDRAADLADRMYIALMQRQQGDVAG